VWVWEVLVGERGGGGGLCRGQTRLRRIASVRLIYFGFMTKISGVNVCVCVGGEGGG
jgi:hypothetical protein